MMLVCTNTAASVAAVAMAYLNPKPSLSMNRQVVLIGVSVVAVVAGACGPSDAEPPETADGPSPEIAETTGEELRHAQEVRFANVRQLTFGGQNAEAYFAFDGSKLTFQASPRTDDPEADVCDQIYTMNLDGSDVQLVSTGQGRTTCSYFYPSGNKILYSSTHHFDEACPADPDFSRGYVWAVYPSYDVFVKDLTTGELEQLTDEPGYDAEATYSPQGDRVVFTSVRDGDLDLYSMNGDGTDVVRLTDRVGYDGGAFYSPDGSQIVWRAHYPDSEESLKDYQDLLAEGLIRPSVLELWVMDADGSNQRQLTDNGGANFGPYWHPSGESVIFSSNMHDPDGREFDLYFINLDGTGLERITYTPDFDGFPVFSPDGRHLVWGSNRLNELEGETNVFIADWVAGP